MVAAGRGIPERTARALLALWLLLSAAATAQVPDAAQQFEPRAGEAAPFERPGERRPEEALPEEKPPPGFVLPPLPAPGEQERGRLRAAPRIVLREIHVRGSSVFSQAELEALGAPLLGQEVGTEELQALRDRLTLLYVNAGYVNSGAVLPDQDVSDGSVEYRIVEGRLAEIQISGQRRFREGWLRTRLERGARVPLSVRELETQLQLLQQDARIARVNAELGPGALPGDGVLRVRVEEARPWHGWVELSNHQSPSIGAYRARLGLSHENLSGNGDVIRLQVGRTDGLQDYELGYALPVNRWDTTLGLRWRYSESDVVEQPFDDVDIESKSQTFAVSLQQPVIRTLNSTFSLSLDAEYRESETFLLGRRFSFSAGAEDGRSKVSVLRFGQAWIYRDRSQVLAARSTLSVGLDLLDATVHGGSTEDGQFLAWLGQFQWTRRFDSLWGVQALVRTDVQLATSALLSLEQFAVGGHGSVRGYRENQLVRDNGTVSSVEVRVPLWTDAAGRPVVQLAPFADIGRSWNTNRGESRPRTLYSAGVGLRWSITRVAHFEVYWAEALRDVATPDDRDLQDTGVHFRIFMDLF